MEDKSIYKLWQGLQNELKTVYPASIDMDILAHERRQALRTELLKRCENTDDVGGAWVELSFCQDMPYVWVGGATPRIAETKDLGAAILFMAWEAEQRENEATEQLEAE